MHKNLKDNVITLENEFNCWIQTNKQKIKFIFTLKICFLAE